MGEGLLTATENDSNSCITKAHPGMSGSSQSWEPGAHCAACPQLSRLESFQAPQLVYTSSCSVSSRQLSGLRSSWQLGFAPLRETLQLLLFTLAGRGLANLMSFRDFLKLFELFTLLPKELPCRLGRFPSLGETDTQQCHGACVEAKGKVMGCPFSPSTLCVPGIKLRS